MQCYFPESRVGNKTVLNFVRRSALFSQWKKEEIKDNAESLPTKASP